MALLLGLTTVAAAALLGLYWDGLAEMTRKWESAEYNHGYMIPFVALYLLWLRAREIQASRFEGSFAGVVLIVVSIVLLALGELSAVFTLTQYAFILAIWALVLAAGGGRAIRLLWVPLLYLVFMVPLPNFLETRLTAGLQLLSSEIGVAVIRAAGMSVFLEGNVIDLGTYKLQVAEACSGMRYLFPLLSFGYLCAVLFRGRWWQRLILLVATVPITILMNSFRIGMIGILVNRFGIEQAEGFLHDFEGWVVFMASVGVLFAIVLIFARMERRPFLEIFGLDMPPVADFTGMLASLKVTRPVVAVVGLLAVAALVNVTVGRPATLVPDGRAPLATFPLRVADFSGREVAVEKVYIDALQVSDHLMADYWRSGDSAPVNLWIAYYDSQVKGASVHSPQACLPGGGWQILEFGEREIPEVLPGDGNLRVNRVEIGMGEDRQLVYYWFAQRGRIVTNEFLVKWLIFWDGLTANRTDGALIRLTTYIDDPERIAEADARLVAFVRAADARLSYHLPGADVTLKPLQVAGRESAESPL